MPPWEPAADLQEAAEDRPDPDDQGQHQGGGRRPDQGDHPGGLGVVEVTLVAISAGFGAPRATAVLAVPGYRVVNYWLPLLPGARAYLRLRLTAGQGN